MLVNTLEMYRSLDVNELALDITLDKFGIFAFAKERVSFMVRLRSSLRRFQDTMQSTARRSIEQINLNAKTFALHSIWS